MITPSQKRILAALVELYEKTRKPVKSGEIAKLVGRDEGTIRNLMPLLKTMKLVEAVPGPKGGYLPVVRTYEVLKLPRPSTGEEVFVYTVDGTRLDLRVTDIEFKDVFSPETCTALLKVIGNPSIVATGEKVLIGPVAGGRLIIEGRVVGHDDLHGEILMEVVSIVGIPAENVGKLISRKLVTIRPDITVREAARVLYRESIRAAPIVENGKLLGIVTTIDIARAAHEELLDVRVVEIASKKLATIREDADILEAMEKMQRERIGRLVVVAREGRPIGIVTRTDILLRLLRPFLVLKRKEEGVHGQ